MMTIEEVLVDLGERRLGSSPYSRVAMAVLNALLPKDQLVTLDTSAVDILTSIYSIQDEALQERILSKRVSKVRNSDTYRTVILTSAVVFVGFSMLFAFIEINKTTDPLTAETSSGFTTIMQGVIEILKLIIGTE